MTDEKPDSPFRQPEGEVEHRVEESGGFELTIPPELVILVLLAVCGTIVAVVYLITSGGGCS